MQLKSLWVKDHKILKDFTIEFPYDFKKYISVFIGANGSGKSTILEVIAQIFSNVVLNETAKFAFELEYSIRHEQILDKTSTTSVVHTAYIIVKLYANKDEEIKVSISSGIDDTDYSDKVIDTKKQVVFGHGKEKSVQSYLPDNIVIYYSGLSEIMKELCNPHEERLSKAYRKGNTNINRDFFYYTPEHFEIILLSLLSYEYGEIPVFLRTKAKIADMQSVQIRLQKPTWGKGSIESFWGAEGEVRKFLDYLNENSASLEDLQEPSKSNKKGNIVIEAWQDEAIIITIIGLERLYEIREHLIEERKLFELLNIMLADGLLNDISFSLIKEENGNYQSFSVLSEGEQQIITIKGLTELLSSKNTLFLFDEPDTYLHPKWQRHFISEIEKTIESDFESENTYVISTHSPLLLSSANPDYCDVKIIENGKIVENTPMYYGREINTILYEHMGVENRISKVNDLLSSLFEKIDLEDIDNAKKLYTELEDLIGDDDPDMVNANVQLGFLEDYLDETH